MGSTSKPVTVDFTTGTTSPPPPNTPITDSPGELALGGEGRILKIEKNSLVNNSFAAPEAEGCRGLLSFLIDPAVDAELKLPSSSGHINGSQEIASASAVSEHKAGVNDAAGSRSPPRRGVQDGGAAQSGRPL